MPNEEALISVCVRLLFFFSSRRRHTRYWRDWSSDVCSSDLVGVPGLLRVELVADPLRPQPPTSPRADPAEPQGEPVPPQVRQRAAELDSAAPDRKSVV